MKDEGSRSDVEKRYQDLVKELKQVELTKENYQKIKKELKNYQ